MGNEGKIKVIIVIEEKKKSGSSLRARLSSGKFSACFVFAFILVCILPKFHSMFEGYRKKPVKKKSLKVEGGKAIALPPRRELDPGHVRRIYLERSGDHFFVWAGRKGINWGKCSYFFNQISEPEQFGSLGVKQRQSREIYFGFKNIAISSYFWSLLEEQNRIIEIGSFQESTDMCLLIYSFSEMDVREVERNHGSMSPFSWWG